MLNGPFTPDRANPISEIAKTAREHGELVTALKLAGRLDFNPLTDELVSPGGEKFKLDPPTGHRLPSKGFDPGQDTYQESPEQCTEAEIHVDPTMVGSLDISGAWLLLRRRLLVSMKLISRNKVSYP